MGETLAAFISSTTSDWIMFPVRHFEFQSHDLNLGVQSY
jgi:hypothetical protein